MGCSPSIHSHKHATPGLVSPSIIDPGAGTSVAASGPVSGSAQRQSSKEIKVVLDGLEKSCPAGSAQSPSTKGAESGSESEMVKADPHSQSSMKHSVNHSRVLTRHPTSMQRLSDIAVSGHLRPFINTILFGVIVTDFEGNMIVVNNPAVEMFGFQNCDCMVGKNITDLMPGDQAKVHHTYMHRLQEGDPSRLKIIGTMGREVTAKKRDGSEFPIRLMLNTGCIGKDGVEFSDPPSSRKQEDTDGAHFVMAVVEDITRIKIAEEQEAKAQLAKAQADADKMAMERFISMTSHDMRAPVQGAMLASQFLLENGDGAGEERNQMLKIISASMANLKLMLDNVLDSHIMQTDKFECSSKPVNLLKELELSLAVFEHHNIDMSSSEESSAKGRGAVLQTDVNWEEGGEFVIADVTMLVRVITNLVSNSFKFTKQGYVRVEISWTARNQQLAVAVKDTGYGMSEEQVQKARELHSRTARGQGGGSGLGLYIADRMISAMGGKMSIESELGRGTCISFEVPCPRAPLPRRSSISSDISFGSKKSSSSNIIGAAESRKRSLQSLSFRSSGSRPRISSNGMLDSMKEQTCLRILVAEDTAINRIVLTKSLRRLGHKVDSVENGKQALDAMKTREHDVIITDINMPEMNGDEATRLYREWEREQGLHPSFIVYMTGNTVMENVEDMNCTHDIDELNGYVSGCNVHVTKPVTPAKLESLLQDYLDQILESDSSLLQSTDNYVETSMAFPKK